jgi:drug/metabolite transporter (DMT)-like permease
MRQIKSVKVIQAAKVMGAVYFVLGLALSILIILPISIARKGPAHGHFFWAVLSPFFYGVLGFVCTAVVCWLYNFIAERLGGIEVEVIESP